MILGILAAEQCMVGSDSQADAPAFTLGLFDDAQRLDAAEVADVQMPFESNLG
ncbi:hypothetical protein SDC9_157861 [bioreactor metagenome]|uniref:Uncharacterized protein n=1 Tax=bioreactor metagenome TaxID=1076179 RepID=A0A645FAD0_9ZZZZ